MVHLFQFNFMKQNIHPNKAWLFVASKGWIKFSCFLYLHKHFTYGNLVFYVGISLLYFNLYNEFSTRQFIGQIIFIVTHWCPKTRFRNQFSALLFPLHGFLTTSAATRLSCGRHFLLSGPNKIIDLNLAAAVNGGRTDMRDPDWSKPVLSDSNSEKGKKQMNYYCKALTFFFISFKKL